jgi:hypothetical protein
MTSRISLKELRGRRCGVAFNPNDGSCTSAARTNTSSAVDTNGKVKKGYDLAGTDIRNQMGVTFDRAPTPRTRPLVRTCSSRSRVTARTGGVTESRSPRRRVAVPTITASCADRSPRRRSIRESGHVSVAYIGPTTDADRRLRGRRNDRRGYHGANMWQFTRSGFQTATGTTFRGTRRNPRVRTTRCQHDVHLRRQRKVWVVKPGPDNQFGNADDIVTSIDAKAVGAPTPKIRVRSGLRTCSSPTPSARVYRVNPVNGVFGDGNDVITHFDVAVGPTDSEGLAYYAPDDAARR